MGLRKWVKKKYNDTTGKTAQREAEEAANRAAEDARNAAANSYNQEMLSGAGANIQNLNESSPTNRRKKPGTSTILAGEGRGTTILGGGGVA